MNIAVIGGSGYIGTNLIKRLQKMRGYNIVSYDIIKPSINVNYIKGDLLDSELLIKTLKNIDVVFLKAGILGIPDHSKNKEFFDNYLNTNIIGVYNVLSACKKNKVKKIIFDSSVAIYGEEKEAIFAREEIFSKPKNFYGLSKVNAERLLKIYSEQNDLNVIILRYSRVRDKQTKDVIFHFLNNLYNNKEVEIYGNPLKRIEFVDIEDVISANILALEKSIKFGQFNISTSEPISIIGLLRLCSEVLNKKIKYKVINTEHDIEPLFTQMDITIAKDILGFIPKINLYNMVRNSAYIIKGV